MKPPRPMVWHKIPLGPDGKLYDIDQDFNAVPSTPSISRDDTGKIVSVSGGPGIVKKINSDLQNKGEQFGPIKLSTVKIDLRNFTLEYPFDHNLRRIAIKMSLATSNYLGFAPALSPDTRSYLLTGEYSDQNTQSPVRVAFTESPILGSLRPKMGHLIYVSHNGDISYSIVQFFSGIQVFCFLGNDKKLKDFSLVATHDPVTHQEEFRTIDSIDFPLPPQFISEEDYYNGVHARFMLMQSELKELYGDQALTFAM